MKRTFFILPALLIISLFILPAARVRAQTPAPVVHAVLFYSPTCLHCEYVIDHTMLPLIDKYGEQLKVIAVDVTQPQGQTLFIAALAKFGLQAGGVPFLVIDNIYLMGDQDIPEKFPGLVESDLAKGGVDWPEIPGLSEAYGLGSKPPTASADSSSALHSTPIADAVSSSDSASAELGGVPTNAQASTWQDRFLLDPTGNTLSVIVLIGMLGSLMGTFIVFRKTKGVSIKDYWTWAIPVLCLIGFGVAAYLTYVETTQVSAVCGPVGDCNTVQQSQYARLFGVLPIGFLGLIGYAGITVMWLIAQRSDDRRSDVSTIMAFGLTVFGTLFSIYLTFLEPFVIGATCAWCLTSAVIMTILAVLMARPAKLAFDNLAPSQAFRRIRVRIGLRHD